MTRHDMTCSSCQKGAWHFVWPDFGVFEQEFDVFDMLFGRGESWRGTPPDASFSFFDNFMTLTYLTCGRGSGTPAEVMFSVFFTTVSLR